LKKGLVYHSLIAHTSLPCPPPHHHTFSLRNHQRFAQLTSSGYRVEALEGQLMVQAQESAHQIARLRAKLFEFEMDMFLREGGLDEELLADVPVGPVGSAAQAAKALNAAAAEGTTSVAAVGAAGGAGGGVVLEKNPPEGKDGGGPEPGSNPENTGGGQS